MHRTRIKPQRIVTQRLDPDYYYPQYLKDEDLLIEFGSDSLAKAGKFFVGPFGSKLPSSLYLNEGIPLFRISNIGSMRVDMEGMAYLASEVHAELSASEVLPGDLLIVKASVGEKICKVPENIPCANITQHIIALRPNGLIDIDYISAFLFCNYGRRQLVRRSLGSIIQYLGVNDTKTVLLPKLDAKVQACIGDKVRQAERLRERSKNLEADFQEGLLQDYPEIFGSARVKGKSSRAELDVLTTNLNPGAYEPERLRIRRYLGNRNGKQLHELARIETTLTTDYSNSDTYIGLDAISSSCSLISPSKVGTERIKGSVRVLAEGPTISRLRPYLNKVSYIPSELGGALGSTELFCIRPKHDVSGWFLYGVLKLESTIRQLNPVSTGSTHPRVSREDILELMLPWCVDQNLRGKRLEEAQKGYFLSERLITAAKLLVEALIEGKLSEADLKAAQEGLEQGDTTLDRAILARLTRKGIDCSNEPPLFPDLDALYTALANLEANEDIDTADSGNGKTANVYSLPHPSIPLASETSPDAYASTEEVSV